MTLFFEADSDGSNSMSMDEFQEALRTPAFQRAFSSLGVQPHQSDLIFQTMLSIKGDGVSGELTIEEFVTGLTELLGTNPDGKGPARADPGGKPAALRGSVREAARLSQAAVPR